MDADLLSIADAREGVRRARAAFEAFRRFDQAAVDRVTHAVVEAGFAAAAPLARLAVEETGIGRVESKIEKNRFATRGVWRAIRGLRTTGILREDSSRGLLEVADPFGVVAAVIPTTNPTSTALFKAIICLKSRNAMVASPHPRAVRCVAESIRIAEAAACAAGAPPGLLACMTHVSIEGTQALMKDRGVDLILATGGSALVRQAYSSGKPAFGVGPGNVPVYVDRSADVAHAARCLVESQTFDNSVLCTSEQSVVCDRPVADRLRGELRERGAHICTPGETARLEALFRREAVTPAGIVGVDAHRVAAAAGFEVPAGTTLLLAPTDRVGREHPLSREKLCPVLAFFEVEGSEEGCRLCIELLNVGGRGHTLGIHAEDEAVVRAFALEKPVNRIVVNSPTAQGGIGATTALFPSLTLGCGSFGGNITSDNIGPQHLLNVKRVGWVRPEWRAGHGEEHYDELPPLPPGAPMGSVRSPWEEAEPAGGPPRAPNPGALPPVAAPPAAPARWPGEAFEWGELERVLQAAREARRREREAGA
jgi:acetaldehyde dehydrogenase (acetylating)